MAHGRMSSGQFKNLKGGWSYYADCGNEDEEDLDEWSDPSTASAKAWDELKKFKFTISAVTFRKLKGIEVCK